MKKLYRSNKNIVIAGVLGGLGEYTDTDPTIWRLGFVILSFMSHLLPAVIVYIIACIVIPKNPSHVHTAHHNSHSHDSEKEKAKEAEYKEEKK